VLHGLRYVAFGEIGPVFAIAKVATGPDDRTPPVPEMGERCGMAVEGHFRMMGNLMRNPSPQQTGHANVKARVVS
jgi:hypothetical protein